MPIRCEAHGLSTSAGGGQICIMCPSARPSCQTSYCARAITMPVLGGQLKTRIGEQLIKYPECRYGRQAVWKSTRTKSPEHRLQGAFVHKRRIRLEIWPDVRTDQHSKNVPSTATAVGRAIRSVLGKGRAGRRWLAVCIEGFVHRNSCPIHRPALPKFCPHRTPPLQ